MRLFYGESVNTTDLARQFGVSTKTIQNDLKELMMTYEIVSEKKGTYRLAQSNRIIEQEYRDTLRALVYALATHAFRGFEKDIEVLLGRQQSGKIEFDTVFEAIEDIETFKLLLQMLRWDYSVEFEYDGAKKAVHPLKIVNRNGCWHLVGYDLECDRMDTYLVNRIENLSSFFENLLRSAESTTDPLSLALDETEEMKKARIKIFASCNESVKKMLPRRCTVVEEQDDGIVVEYGYTTEKECFDFAKQYLPSVQILDPKLDMEFRKMLEEFMMRKKVSDL